MNISFHITLPRTPRFGCRETEYANTVSKTRWIGSAQIRKVGVKDVNPKDHIFVPAAWRVLGVDLLPAPGEYMTPACPSDHRGLGAERLPAACLTPVQPQAENHENSVE